MASRDFNFAGFTRVNIRFAVETEIIRSEGYRVTVSGSDSLMENLDVHQEGDFLVVGYHLNFVSLITAPFSHGLVTIYMPDIQELRITGAARGVLKGFNSDKDFRLNISGAGQVEFSDFAAGNMRWELSGASRINGQITLRGDADIKSSGASHIALKGLVRDISLDAAGASQIDLQDFTARNAKIRLTGASRSNLNLNGQLDVDLSGASKLEYEGKVSMGEVRVSGASSLRMRG